MNLRQVIPRDVTASAIVHLLLLALVFLFSDVHPFGAVTAETVAVDIVTPQELVEQQEIVEKKPEPEPTPLPQPDFSQLDNKQAATSAAAAAPQQPAAQQPPQQAASPPPAARPTHQQVAAAQPQAQPAAQPQAQPVVQPQAQPVAQPPAYAPPEPDLSVKYHVMLGLPAELPLAATRSGDKADADFDAPATKAADVASSLVAQFRQHLKTCSKLPTTLKTSDDVKVKLRVLMTPAGKLAADPILIEASASMKGPLLMKSAISALEACQPYTMLPADRYGEWKVLDLSFTPQDFAS
jgi:hypothetical protein